MAGSLACKLWFRFRSGTSMWASFLAERYCRQDHPGIVSIKSGASPCWRRMIKFRSIVEPNIRWRLGAGNLSFWDDIWQGDSQLAFRLGVVGDRSAKVHQFWLNGRWDSSKLCASLPLEVVRLIEAIPLRGLNQDTIVWCLSNDGNFSTKSAWEFIRPRRQKLDIYTSCWKRWIRPTLSFFIWRLLHKWIPVDEMIVRKGVHLASRCQCCSASETIEHVFLNGPVAHQVWHFFGALCRVRCVNTASISIAMSVWKKRLKWSRAGSLRETLPILILWFLWIIRNEAKHNQNKCLATVVCARVISYLAVAGRADLLKPRFWAGHTSTARSFGFDLRLSLRHSRRVVPWVKPGVGCFKLNTDGGAEPNPGSITIGGIFRNEEGQTVLAFSGRAGIGSNCFAELLAIRHGLQLGIDQNLLPLWVETDSLTAIRLIQSNSCNWSLASLVTDIRNILQNTQVRVSHICREGNRVADALASWGRSLPDICTFHKSSLPTHIAMLAARDMFGPPSIRIRRSICYENR